MGLIETRDELEEADVIISFLKKEIKLNKEIDFAILYRTNAQSRPIEDSHNDGYLTILWVILDSMIEKR